MVLRNEDGAPVAYGSGYFGNGGFTGLAPSQVLYCGRYVGRCTLVGVAKHERMRMSSTPCTDGFCGPNNGCPCVACYNLLMRTRSTEINVDGDKAWLGCDPATGKYYCGKVKHECRCGRCDGRCGPDNGCSCDACRALSYLKNRSEIAVDGRRVFHGTTGTSGDMKLPPSQLYYCGEMKNECRCGGCDGRCGPGNGCPCNQCKALMWTKLTGLPMGGMYSYLDSLPFSFQTKTTPATSTSTPQENYLFLGNPGTGKSTLINCLIGRQVFSSGVNYGEGLTQFFQKRRHDGIVYMDTPGLADRKIQLKAAAAITEALRETGRYKLFFMVRLENGRVVSDDLTTIETVMESIDMKDVPFSIIVNNVKRKQYAKMMEKGEEFWKVVTLINSIKFKTANIVFIPALPSLEEEDNAFTELPTNVKSFINSDAPAVVVAPSAVNDIRFTDFKKVSDRLRAELEILQLDNAALHRRMLELQRKPGFFRKLGGSTDGAIHSIISFFTGIAI